MGAQTSPTNFGNPMDVFGKADATRAAMPNLFSTIQAVRANELERQTKQAAISKVLQDLVIQQKLAPIEQAYKQAQTQSELMDIKQAPFKQEKLVADTEKARSGVEKDKSTIKVNKSLAKYLDGNGSESANPEEVVRIASEKTGFGEEDFDVEPVQRSIRGVPVTSYVPKLKAKMPVALEKQYRGFSEITRSLAKNLSFLEKEGIKEKMGPFSLEAQRPGTILGNIGNIMLKLDPNSKEFAVFKAETDKAFQVFRKETTGAQAALAELGWLAPDYPELTDNPELYKAKALEAISRLREGEELLLQTASAQGYRTSNLKKVKSPAKKVVDGLSDDDAYQEYLRLSGGA
jgi:hypothetical protein